MSKQVFQILSRPIAFHRCLVPISGSVTAALMLSQAIYWTPRTRDRYGWFYKSQKDWEEETGLTRSEQEIARKLLRVTGFWHEKLRGVPATLYYCVDCEILQTRLQEFNILVCEKLQSSTQEPANKIAEISKLSQRLPESTSENTAEEAAAAFHSLDYDHPFGHPEFQEVWIRRHKSWKGTWLSEVLEATIQECQEKNIGVPPPFYEAKHYIDALEKAQFEQSRKRVPM
jgi:hypothetical protein